MTEQRELIFLEEFLQEAKRLRKKYRQIDADIKDFADRLENGENPGDRLQGLADYLIYKARIASRDMQRGKSGEFRVIYYLQTESKIFMLTIYAKTEQEDISASEILEILTSSDEEE